jgi:hypothetical protein
MFTLAECAAKIADRILKRAQSLHPLDPQDAKPLVFRDNISHAFYIPMKSRVPFYICSNATDLK